MEISRCPICNKQIPAEQMKENEFFPFCSQRCQLIDLGHWLDGDYVIPDRREKAEEESEGEEQ